MSSQQTTGAGPGSLSQAGDSYWAGVWADPNVAELILQKGKIFTLTRRLFLEGLRNTCAPLEQLRILDFGCGDGALLADVECAELLLYEPSPTYTSKLEQLSTHAAGPRKMRVVPELKALPTASVDLIIMHSVAQYLSYSDLAGQLLEFRRLLSPNQRGVIIADIPHPNRVVDVLGALSAHLWTIPQVLGQMASLLGSPYSSARLARHQLADLVRVADQTGYQCLRLSSRSFNRARVTVLLRLLDLAGVDEPVH